MRIDKRSQDEELHDLSLEIVNGNSGGLKFAELLAHIITRLTDAEKKEILWMDKDDNFSCRLENIIRQSKKLKVLDYTWQELNRAKMFVYTE